MVCENMSQHERPLPQSVRHRTFFDQRKSLPSLRIHKGLEFLMEHNLLTYQRQLWHFVCHADNHHPNVDFMQGIRES